MGENANTAFKRVFGASASILGGMLDPDTVGIVGLPSDHPYFIPGVDVPLADWCEDLWDQARLVESLKNPIDPQSVIRVLDAGGKIPAIEVTSRRDLILTVEGRRRLLAVRGANRLIQAAGTQGHDLISIPATATKGTDLDVSVRVGNAGRFNDPPWVRARNCARMTSRGKSDEVILATEQLEATTLKNYRFYMDLDPTIQALVEGDPAENAPHPFNVRLPFNVGFELGKLGKGETARQVLALTVLLNTGAQLTGEQGRANAKAVMKGIKDGQITEAPPLTAGGPPAQDQAPDSQDGDESTPPSGPKPRGGGTVVAQSGKMTTSQIRQVFKTLETLTDKDPLEVLVFATLAVLQGVDPTASYLADVPRIQALFKDALGIKGPVAPKPPKPAPEPKIAKAPEPPAPGAQDQSTRSLACPNGMCNKGVDTSKGKAKTCGTCGGYGKISPHEAHKIQSALDAARAKRK